MFYHQVGKLFHTAFRNCLHKKILMKSSEAFVPFGMLEYIWASLDIRRLDPFKLTFIYCSCRYSAMYPQFVNLIGIGIPAYVT